MKVLSHSINMALLLFISVQLAWGQAPTTQWTGKFPKAFSPEANFMSQFGFMRHQYWLKHKIWVLPEPKEIRLKAQSEADAIILLSQVVPANPKHHTFVVEVGQSLLLRYERIFEGIYRDARDLEQTPDMGEMWTPYETVMAGHMTEEILAEQAKKLIEERKSRR